MLAHQRKLRLATLKQNEVFVWRDFAADIELEQRAHPLAVCAANPSVSLYSAIVCFWEGGEWRCEWWGIFSGMDHDATCNSACLKLIINHFTATFGGRVDRWVLTNDGQFKTRRFLGRLAVLPHPPNVAKGTECLCCRGEKSREERSCNVVDLESGMMIPCEMIVNAPHHGGGPADALTSMVKQCLRRITLVDEHDLVTASDCAAAMQRHYPQPSKKRDSESGKNKSTRYMWQFINADDEAHANVDYQACPGPQHLFYWKAESVYKPLLSATFIPCFCTNCRSGGTCPISSYVYAATGGDAEEFMMHRQPPRRRQHTRSAAAEDVEEEWE